MRKGVTGLQNIQLLKWCREFGLDARWNFLWGFPGEAPAEYERLGALVPLLTHLQPPAGYDCIRLDRFSPNFFDAERLGFTDLSPFVAYRHVYRLPDAAIANLACYFTYRYREPRDVDKYVRPLTRELDAWKRARTRAELVSAEAGDYLVIVDLRPASAARFLVLSGLARLLYLECDAVRDLRQLQEIAASRNAGPPSAVESLLAALVEHRVMVRDGSRHLALAIRMGEYRPGREAVQQFSKAVREAGIPGDRQWTVPAVHLADGGNGRGAERLHRQAGQARRRPPGRAPGVPPLTASRFSMDARGRLVIEASEYSRQRRRSG
jgi:hypothetical protein